MGEGPVSLDSGHCHFCGHPLSLCVNPAQAPGLPLSVPTAGPMTKNLTGHWIEAEWLPVSTAHSSGHGLENRAVGQLLPSPFHLVLQND